MMQISHLVRTVQPVLLLTVCHTAHQKLDLEVGFVHETLCGFEDQMDAFLSGDSTNEGKKRHFLAHISTLEIFFLKQQFRISMISWSFCSENAESFLFSDPVGE